MNRSVLVLLCLCFGSLTSLAAQQPEIRKVEERSRYLVGAAEGAHLEVVVIRRHLDSEVNPTAILRFASIEVAELRDLRLAGKYNITHGYTASVDARDDEGGGFASSLISGVGKEIVTIRVLSWGLNEEEHRARAAELIARFKA